MPLYDVLRFLVDELKKENIIIRSNAMAFSFLLSLFPAIIFLFTLLPYLPIAGFVSAMKQAIAQVMPYQATSYIFQIIDQLTSIQREGLLSVSLLLTLIFTSNGMLSMLRGFEKKYEITYKPRSGIRRRLVAIQLTVILGVLFISSITLVVLGRVLLESLLVFAQIDAQSFNVILILRWIAIILMFYTGISIVYRYGPALHRRIRFLSPGATLATVLSLLSSLAFSYYVNKFDTYNEVYGSLGALIVLMLWLQINSLVILLGYELNASIKITRDRMRLEDVSDENRKSTA